MTTSSVESTKPRPLSPSVLPLPREVQLAHHPNENQIQPLSCEEGSISGDINISNSSQPTQLERGAAGDVSFRFQDFSLSSTSNWV
jgi:hypothetical protein